MKTKCLLLSALLVLALLLSACGGSPSPAANSPGAEGNTPAQGDNGLDWTPQNTNNEITPVPAGAIDFSDGNLDYIMINLSPGDADPSELSIIDYNGGKALKIEVMEGGFPYVGFDVTSMFGDKVADIRKIEMRILTENPDGTFYASSGNLTTYTGADNFESKFLWGVAMEKNNPKTLVAELGDDAVFATGAKNIIVLCKTGDNASAAREHPSNLIIDYIAFYDASGNIMQADTSISFDPPAGFGSVEDRTMLFSVTDEVKLDFKSDGATGSSTGWGQAGKIDDIDFSLLQPGSIITVHYKSEKVPELIFQNWSGAPAEVIAWGKIAPYTSNLAGNIAQYRYEDFVAGFGTDDFATYLNRINVGDWGCDLDVTKVTIGQRVEEDLGIKPVLIGHDGFNNITKLNQRDVPHSEGNYSQAFRINAVDDPSEPSKYPAEFDPNWLVPGSFATVYYSSEKLPQVILQRYGYGDLPNLWVGVNSDINNESMGIAQFSYDALLAAWQENGGGDLIEELFAFWMQDTNAVLDIFKVVLFTPPATE